MKPMKTHNHKPTTKCTEWNCVCGHCYNLQLRHMLREVRLRGWNTDKLASVYRRADKQLQQGDPEYTRLPALQTILRRVLKGEYDYLFFNN